MPVSVCSAYQRYLRMLLPIKCHPLNPIPRARLWYVGNPHTQSGGFHHGSWGLVPSRYTNSPPTPPPLPETYDKPLGGNVAEEAFCQKPAPMGWVHCAAVPPLGACMDDDWWKGKAAVGVSNVSISQKGQLDEGK